MKLLKNLKSDPKILTDIVEEVRNEKIRISEAVEGEGRCGSLKDEGTIIRFLKATKLSKYILSEKARKFGDMIVLDYDGKRIGVKTITQHFIETFIVLRYHFGNLQQL